MGALAQAGLVINRNKESVKAALDKYKIPYGNGSTVAVILATFTAIKGGNKDLATDLATIMKADEKTIHVTKNPLSSSIAKRSDVFASFKAAITNKLNAIKSGKVSVSNADGDVTDVSILTDQLTSELGATDINAAVKTGTNASGGKSIALCVVAVIIGIGIIMYIGSVIIKSKK